MEGFDVQEHKVVSRQEWLESRREHLAREKELTRLRDRVSQERRELPWVRVEQEYDFDGPNGKRTLSELFDGRSQLLVYHFMFGPDWEEGCKSCSFWADNYNGILRGEACLVAAGIRRSATRRKLTPDNRENVDQCADYLLNHASYLHYDECLAAGFPIATGVIEGACRHLVSDRMDLTGARWSLAGAEAVLRLRALRSSGDFDEYWRFHEQCEYERNHASRYADGKVVPVKGRHLKRVK